MSLLNTSRVSLLALGVVGWFTLHKFTETNDLFVMIDKAVKRGKIPGGPSYTTEITGTKQLDNVANILLQFFWPVVDGKNLDTSLAGAILGTQGVAAFTLTVLEGYRKGNYGRIISFTTIFGVLVQLFGFGFISPFYLLVHLLTVPLGRGATAESVAVPEHYLREIPISQVLGFFLPTVMMCLPFPKRLNMNSKVQAILFWQLFPVWSAIYLEILGRVRRSSKTYTTTAKSSLSALRQVYWFALIVSASAHIAILGVSLCAQFRPELVGPRRVLSLRPAHLYMPPNPLLMEQKAATIDQGAFWFLKWDNTCTVLAYLIWGTCVKYSAFENVSVTTIIQDVIIKPVLLGPASAALLMVWDRDELVLGRAQQTAPKAAKVPASRKG